MVTAQGTAALRSSSALHAAVVSPESHRVGPPGPSTVLHAECPACQAHGLWGIALRCPSPTQPEAWAAHRTTIRPMVLMNMLMTLITITITSLVR